MLSIQVVVAFIIGFILGASFILFLLRTITSAGDFVIRRDEDGLYSYELQLEEEPEALHNSRHIFFKVKKSH